MTGTMVAKKYHPVFVHQPKCVTMDEVRVIGERIKIQPENKTDETGIT